jgi:hypothetical protein
LLGEIYYLQEKYDAAAEEFQKAVEGIPNPSKEESRYRSSLALAYLEQGRFEDAQRELETLREREENGAPLSAEDYTYLGIVYEQAGIRYQEAGRQKNEITQMHQSAKNAFRQALERDATFLPAKAYLKAYLTPTRITVTPSQPLITYLWKDPKPIQFEASGVNRYDIELDKTELPIVWTITGGIGSIDEKDGMFTPMSPGEGKVRAISHVNATIRGRAEVTVIGIDRIHIQPECLMLYLGDVKEIQINVYDTQGNQIPMEVPIEIQVTGGVVELHEQQLTAVKPGCGQVRVSFGGKVGTASITVVQKPKKDSHRRPVILSFIAGGLGLIIGYLLHQ